MGYFSDNTIVTLNKLKESGIYPQELLEEIENKNYNAILDLVSDTQRRDIDYMEPLLYAVKNEHNTYAVYKCYGKNIQDDIELAKKIVINEPELIRDTPVSYNRQFILEAVEINPEVVMHMSNELKLDGKFTQELCELNNSDITRYAAQECKMPETLERNPALSEDKDFMLGLIQKDANSLQYASAELKNNSDFIKEICGSNKEVIDYISNHTDQFGIDGLKGAQSVLKEDFKTQAKNRDQKELELIPKLRRLQELQTNEENLNEEERAELNELKNREDLRELGEELSRREEKKGKPIDLEAREKSLKRHEGILDRRLTGLEEGDEKAIRFAKRLLKCDLDPEYREMIEKSLKIGEAIIEKQKEEKDKETPEPQERQTPETRKKELTNDVRIGIGDIETRTEGVSLEDVRKETQGIREEIKRERDEKETGEQTNGGNVERT